MPSLKTNPRAVRPTLSPSCTMRPVILLCSVVLVMITLAIYYPAIWYDFVDDDFANLDHNAAYMPVTLNALIRFWTDQYIRMYLPVTYTEWGVLIWALKSLGIVISAAPFHLLNIIGHAISSILVYRILLLLFTHNQQHHISIVVGSFLGALLFALHPLQIESVAYCSGWKDVSYPITGRRGWRLAN